MKTLLLGSGSRGYPVTSILGQPNSQGPSRLDQLDEMACIILDGKTPVRRPLRVYSTDDIDLLEVYPSGTELTGTIAARMTIPECQATSLFVHPTYYVLWFKGHSP